MRMTFLKRERNGLMIPFRLNLDMIKDDLSSYYKKITLYEKSQKDCLEDVRFFQKDTTLCERYVYIIRPEEMALLPKAIQGMAFVVAGKSDLTLFPNECRGLFIEQVPDLIQLLIEIQNIFEKYRNWNLELYTALEDSDPLDAMLCVSKPIFHNPIFVHDVAFNILSCSHRAPGMLEWEEDAAGTPIIPLHLINDFRVDPDYLATLTTTEPDLYPSEQRGYPILYMNIWQNGHYEGRICVDELETPILPGQYACIAHLEKMILLAMGNHGLMQFHFGSSLKQFFRDYLSHAITEQDLVFKMMNLLGWKQHDSYLCLRLEARQQDIRMMSSAAVIGHIETQVSGSCAFVYQNGISVIVNLTHSKIRIPDVLSSLAILLREGLMKMGASTEVTDFLMIPEGHEQAVMALDLGLKSSSMNWCYRFDDYFLEFLYRKSSEILPTELLCSHKLKVLKEYDQANNTELYETLKIFLELERNVLQTSKRLFIHRSTLFYRLERISKVAEVNLDDAKERLVLRISFYFQELQK